MMASPLAASSSRASTPESPLAKAATTIDDLTAALSNFSRAPTPDPPITCCCHRDDCEAASSWASFRAKLESRLVLSAEVGQALLERHEAYVRRQDAALSRQASSIFEDEDTSLRQHVEYLTKKLDTVTEENTLLESRLNELLIKHEMSDASSRTVMRELHEARASVSRLSAHHARSVGWEMRLAQQTQEKDDMRQERDSEYHRARLAESKAAAFVDKCSKLQSEVHTLREEVHNFRASRADFSKNVLQEARVRLEALQHSLGRDQAREDPETTRVLESLVADNETLKRDTAELQNLLMEAREDVRTLREELEERRASAPSAIDEVTRVGTPPPTALYLPRTPTHGRFRGHHATNSTASASSMLYGLPHAPNPYAPSPHAPTGNTRHHRRSLSGNARLVGNDAIAEWRDGQFDSLLPPLRPRSPADSLLPPDAKHASFGHPPRYSPSHHSGELDQERQRGVSPVSPEKLKSNVKSLMLLSRSRGVQTDPPVVHALPSPRPSTLGVDRDSTPSTPTPEARSDTSSVDQRDPRSPGAVAALIERVAGLLVRMKQADVKTLTNRLKRQHLLPSGGDARHLSHATVSGILNEVANLRAHVGTGKDDVTSTLLTVTRSDIKALLKLFKDTFAELGGLREQVNEVVFDPSVAHRLRKEATEPERAKGEPRPTSAMGGWIAPIQKLFANPPPLPSTNSDASSASGGANKSPSEVGRGRAPARVVPKLAPAISASSTTVNVEFASTGVRKTDTSDGSIRAISSSAGVTAGSNQHVSGPTALMRPIAVSHSSSRNLMGIFAGAPQSFHNPPPVAGEGWVVLPKNEKDRVRQLKGAVSSTGFGAPSARNGGGGTIRRSSARNANHLSRNVDAVIDQNDDQVSDFRETLLERTLRPRGLSDSSIHTTFMKGDVPESPSENHPGNTQRDRNGSLHFMNKQLPMGASSPSATGSIPSSAPQGVGRHYGVNERDERARSPAARLGMNLASWATAAAGRRFDDGGAGMSDNDILVGSPREDGVIHHAAWARRGLEGRDF